MVKGWDVEEEEEEEEEVVEEEDIGEIAKRSPRRFTTLRLPSDSPAGMNLLLEELKFTTRLIEQSTTFLAEVMSSSKGTCGLATRLRMITENTTTGGRIVMEGDGRM
ncbi:hypothetical protein HZH66_006652 [Vespula vulgaris]|uniref:Uncharacterized protein n=1 Tax=Vespula vulgaris TaxID=7454 RepID=A0A834K2M9_VESVU|nr:hypothetical protein HZH66_006652 [Vespula vulgaris]